MVRCSGMSEARAISPIVLTLHFRARDGATHVQNTPGNNMAIAYRNASRNIAEHEARAMSESRTEAGRCAGPFCRGVDIFNSHDVRHEIAVAKVDPAGATRRCWPYSDSMRLDFRGREAIALNRLY